MLTDLGSIGFLDVSCVSLGLIIYTYMKNIEKS